MIFPSITIRDGVARPPAVIGLVVMLLGAWGLIMPASTAEPLISLTYRINGTGLQVSPAVVSVPKGIAGSVFVSLVGGEATQALAEGAYIEAYLRGPGFPEPRRIVSAVNQPMLFPPLNLVGDYQLDSIRLVDSATGATRMEGSPSIVPVRVFDEVLVSRVTSRPLTYEEIQEKGIFIDESNFRVVEFEAAFVLDGKTIPITFPVVSPKFVDSVELIPAAELEEKLAQAAVINSQIAATTELPPEFEVSQLNIQVQGINFQVVDPGEDEPLGLHIPPIPALMVIPGNIGYLNQFFSVQIFTENAAPRGSGLSVYNIQATLKLPPGPDLLVSTNYAQPGDDPLRFARIGPDKLIQPVQSIVQPGSDGAVGTPDDVPRLGPGESGQAEFLVEGLQEGLHVMDLDLAATMDGLAAGPVQVKGKAAGSVLVRNPRFSMAFSHPRTVRAGEPYEASVTLLNTGITPANLVQITLNKNSISGARLEDESQQTVELGTILPGQSATATFRMRSLRTGAVSFSNLTTSDDSVVGRFRLSMGVDERGVALSPDSLALPDAVNGLPPALLAAANRVLGQALSVATAGQVPPGVIRVAKSAITRRVLDLAEAGQRLTYGDPARRVLADLLRDWQGGRIASDGFDQILRETQAGREWRDALFAAIESADALSGSARLADRAADYAGLGQEFVVAGTDDGRLWVDFGDGKAGADLAGSTQPYALVYSGARGAWAPLRHDTNATVFWTFTNGPPSADLTVLLVSTNGSARQLRWAVPNPPPDATYSFSLRQSSDQLQVDLGSDGSVDAAQTAVVTPVQELPPVLVAVEQDLRVNAGRPANPCIGPPWANYGTVVAVVFSKPMTQDSAGAPDAYTVDGDNGANSVQVQPGGRVAYLNLRKGISAIIPRSLTLTGVMDVRSNLLAVVTVPIHSVEPGTEVPFTGGVAIRGRALKGDGSPAPGIPVTLTMYDQAYGAIQCEPFVRRVSQVLTDTGGNFTFDFVLAGVPYSISATDTSGLSEEALTLIAQNTAEGQVERERILQLATSAATRDTLLGLFAAGSLPEAIAKVEGLDRALVRDAVQIGSGREGQTVPIALRFRGRATVIGQVVAADGTTPVPKAAVNLFPDAGSRELGRGILADGEGRFAFYGVPLGIYSVEVQTSDRRTRTVAGLLETPGGVVTLTIALPSNATPLGGLRGTVFEADNLTAHGGARVFIGKLGGSLVTDVVRIVEADADGNWQADNLPAQIFDIVAISQDGRRKGVRAGYAVLADALSVANLALEATTQLFGRVQFEDGRPAANALVAGGVTLVRTDGQGNFTLEGVPVGNRQISAGVERDPTAGIDFPRLGSASVNVVAGANNYVVVKLRAAGRIFGRVTDLNGGGIGGIRVAIPVEGGFYWTDADSRGNYSFENMALGGYTLSAPANATAPQLDVPRLTESIRTGNEDEILAAFEEAIRVFVGADDPLITGEQRNFRPITWGYTETRLQFDGQSVEANIRMLREGTVAGRVVNHQGVPIGARVRLTGRGPALNGEPKMTIRGERDSDPATGLFIFPGQLLAGPWTVQAASPFYPVVIQANGFTTEIEPNATNVVLQFPPIQDTNGRLVGRVLQPDGAPAGKDVRVKISFSDDYEIRTDEEGAFDTQIAVPARGYRAEAIDDVSGLRGEAYVTVAAGITNQVEVRLLTRSSAIEVTVLRGNGQPASGAQVDLEHGSFPREARVVLFADANGRVQFQNLWEGRYAVSAQYTEAATRVAARGAAVVGAGETGSVTLRLGGTGTVTGTFVKLDLTTPVEAAQVTIGNLGFATTDVAGRFRFEGVPLGSYSLVTSDPVTGAFARGSATVTFAEQVVDVRIVEGARGEVNGYVLDSYGQSFAPGATVRINYQDGLTPSRTVTTGPDGRYSFPGSPVGAFSLSANDRSIREGGRGTSGSASGTLDATTLVVSVDIQLQRLGTVPVRVVRQDGTTPAENATVSLRGVQRDTGADGTVFFDNLPLGNHPVSAVSRRGGELRNGVAGVAPVTQAGTNALVTLTLPGVGAVQGIVVSSDGTTPVPGSEVVLIFQAALFGGQSVTAVSGADGRFAFADVPVGDYRVTASSVSLAASISASISTGGESDEVTLRLGDSGSVTGRLVRADGVTPVGGVDVLILYASQSANPGRAFVRSGADGRFAFANVPVGSLSLEAVAVEFGGVIRRGAAVESNGQTLDLGDLVFDEQFPYVVSVTPPDTAEEVSTTTAVDLEFSEALAAASLNTNGIFLRSVATGLRVPITLELSETNGVARLLRVVPEVPMASEQIHEMVVLAGDLLNAGGGVIGSGPRDLVGRPLTAPFVSRFKTADNDPPVLLSLFPTNGTIQVDPRAVPRLSFNETLRPTGFSFRLAGPDGDVAGAAAVGVDGRVLSFVPTDVLKPNNLYTLTVSNVFDLAGNRAAGEPFRATFNTLDTVGPTIATLLIADGRTPAAGATIPVEALLAAAEPGASVRFSQDFNAVGTDTNAPFRGAIVLPRSGSTTVRAIATDVFGNDGPVAELVIAVEENRPPSLRFTRVSPTTGPAPSGSFVAVDVEALDDSGVSELKAIVAGIGTGDLARTNATKLRVQGFVSAAAGPGAQVEIFAEAKDDLGQSSGQQVFTLEISDGSRPELAILSPTNNARIDPTRPLQLAVRMADNFTNAALSVAITGAATNDQTVVLPLVSNQAVTNVFLVPLDDLPQTGGTLFARVTATDDAGNSATADAVYRLTDASFPLVAGILPADAATNAAVLPFIVVTFSESLDTNTVTAASFTVTGPGGTAAPGSLRFGGTNHIVLWEASRALAFGSEYTVSLTPGITDVNGNPIDPFTSRFTVASFGIVEPTNGAPVVEGQVLPLASAGPNPAGVREVTYRLRDDVQTGTNTSFSARVSVPLLAELGGSQAQIGATALVHGANVARTATATASSEGFGGTVGRIIDGNRSGNWGNGSVAHTGNASELHPWFDVDLGRVTQIQRLGLYFRTDTGPEQSAMAVLVAPEPFVASDFAGEELPATYLNGAVELFRTTNGFALGSIEISTAGIGRYVRVVHLGRGYLTLAELEAYDGPEPNFALSAAATQSSEYSGLVAQNAVDGNRNNITHTLNNPHEFLDLDFGTIRELGQVDLYLRRDCCQARNRVAVLVAEQPFIAEDFTAPELPATYRNGAVEIYRTTAAYDENVRIPTTAAGRYLRIVHLGQDYLSISEVEIFQRRFDVPLAPVVVQVYSRDADTDGDGVSNGEEIDQGSNPFRADEKPVIQFPNTIEIVLGVLADFPVVVTDGDGNLRSLAVSEIPGAGQFEARAEFWNHSTGIGNLSQAPFHLPPTYVTNFAQLSFPYNTAPWFPGGQSENVAGRFTGRLQVPEAGNYTFYLDSDDGSRLSLDDVTVIDHDGLHSASERSASLTLEAGSHALEVLYFNNGGPGQVIVSWQGPNFAKRLVAGSDFSRFETLRFAESGTTSVISPTDAATLNATVEIGSSFTNEAQLRFVAEDADGLVTERIVGVVTLPDLDGDGIADRDDPDMDGDTLSNANELLAGTDPRSADTDSDGAPDNADRNPLVANRIPVAAGGGAFRFDGVDDVLNAGSPEALRITGDLTLEFWIYAENTARVQTIIAKAYAGEGAMALLDNGQLRYHYGNLGSDSGSFTINYHFADSGQPLPRRAWTHVALVRDGDADKLRWYFNGELTAEADIQISPIVAGDRPLTIGNGWAGPFSGEMDEVRVWNSARTPEQIRSLMLQRAVGNEANLAAAWSFEGVTNSAPPVTRDSSTNRVHAGVGGWLPNSGPQPIESAVFAQEALRVTGTGDGDLGISLAASDADGEPLSGIILELPSAGALYQTADGVTRGAVIGSVPATVTDAQRRVIFAPPAGTNGLFTFRYTVSDSQDEAFPATVFLNLLPANRAPVAVNDTLAAFQDSPTVLSSLLTNDTDADGDALKVIPTTQPAHGRLSRNQNGEWVYTPDGGFAGQDTFTYALVDGLSWNRELDFRPGTVNLSTQGNPSLDRFGLPTWRMDYLAGGGLSDSAPWYRRPPGRLLWDNDWYGNGGYWAYQDNFGAIVWKQGLSQNLSGGGWFDSIPAVSWISPLSGSVDVIGELEVEWNGNNSVAANVGVDIVIASRLRADGSLTLLYTNTVFKPTPANNRPESLRLPVTLANVAVGPGDELVLTHRGHSSTGSHWVNVYDRLHIVPTASTRYATVAINIGANAVPVAQAHPASSALRFDGGNDYVRFGETFTGFPAGDLTVEFWMKSSDTTKAGTVLSYAVPGQDNEFMLFDYRNFSLYARGASRSLGVGGVAGQWRHVAVTRSREDGQTRVYLDGVLVATVTVEPGTGFRDGGVLVLGQDQDSLGGGFEASQAFWGDLDEVRIWDRVRTAEEIEGNRWVRVTGTEPGLVANWSFNDASGLTVANAVSGGAAGMLGYGDADQAPVWVEDYAPFDTVYQTPEDTTVPVTLSGTDADHDPLTAIVTDLPAHGTLHQTANGTTISGPLGGSRARRFDGVNDIITLPENSAGNLSGQAQWTVTAWIRPRSARQGFPVIYAEGKWRLSLGLDSGTGLLDSWVNDAAQIHSDRPVVFDEWQHVAVTSSDTARTFYISGQPAGTGSAPAMASDVTGAAIGGVIAEVDNARNRFEGDIDEVAIWNRALSPAEIADLATGRLTGEEPGLMAWWPLDEPSGTAVADATGNGSNGVAGGGVAEQAPGFTLNSSPAFAATLPRVTHPENKLVYVPDDEWSGLDAFTYRVNDGKVDSADARLYVRTLGADDAPVAVDDAALAVSGFPQTVGNVLTNDFDLEGDLITLLDFTQPANGTLESNGDGTFLYRANNGFSGVDFFTYRVTDGTSPSAPARVTLQVAAPAQFRWVNGAGGNWGDPANWSANRVPTADDDVFITEAGTYTVTVNVDATARRLIVGGSSGTQTLALGNRTLDVRNDSFVGARGVFLQTSGVVEAQAGRWTIEGGFEWTGGRWHGPGVTELTPSATATLGLPSTDLYLNNGRRLVNRSTLVLQARRLFLANTVVGGAAVENRGEMSLDGEADVEWSNSSSQRPVFFINGGTLRKTGAGVSRIEPSLSSAGPLQAAAGTLQLLGGGDLQGPVVVESGSTLSLAGGEWRLSGPVTGEGTFQLGNATLNLAADQTVTRFTQSGGDVVGPGNLRVTAEFQWTNGRQIGGAVTELLPDATASLSGGALKQLGDGRRLVNRGNLEISGNWIYLNNPNVGGAGVQNFGTLAFREAAGIYWNSSDNARLVEVENRGSITSAIGAGNGEGTRIIAPFANTGTLRVHEGRFGLARGSIHSGSVIALTNTVLSFQGGDHAFATNSALSGAGELVLSTGSASFDSTLQWTGPVSVLSGTFAFNARQTFGAFTQNDGSVTGAGPVTVTNRFTWNSGWIFGPGLFEVAETAAVTLGGGNKVVARGRTVVNRSTFSLGGNLYLGNNTDIPTRFENRGTFILPGGEAVPYTEWDGSKPVVFANLGTLEKRGESTVSYFDVPFENSGVMQIREGTLRLLRDGVHSGALLVAAPARLEISRGTHRLADGSQWSGAGGVDVSSATLALETALHLGTLQVTFANGAALTGAFPVANDPGGRILVNQTLTFPGDLLIGGLLNIGAPNHTVTVDGTLTLAATGTIENPGTLRVGAFVDDGGTVQGNPPEVIGTPLEGTVAITAILRGGGEVEPMGSSGEPSLILRWQAPTSWGYEIEASSDLQTWMPLPGKPIILSAQRFETRIPLPGGVAQFFRVRWHGTQWSGEK